MKTNHQRGFKSNKDPRAVYSRYFVHSDKRVLENGHVICAGVTSGDHTNGKRGIAKDRRGAKKFINSRVRFHENAILKRKLKEEQREETDS